MSNLALYHARRIPAAVSYRLYERTHDAAALDEAIRQEKNAIKAWKMIVTAADGVYADTLMMGPLRTTLTGSWKQELGDLQTGLAKLEQQRKAYTRSDTTTTAPVYKPDAVDYSKLFTISHQKLTSARPGTALTVRIKVHAAARLQWVHLLYRDVNQYKEFSTIAMKATGTADEYEAVIPGNAITAKWDLMYLFEIMDKNKKGTIWPDLEKETPYVVVRVIQ